MRMHHWILSFVAVFSFAGCSASAPIAPADFSRVPASEPLLPEGYLEGSPVIDWDKLGAKKLSQEQAAFWRRVVGDRGVDFRAYSNLFPKRFRIVPGEDVQDLVDRVTQKLFTTPTGRKSLCFISTADDKFVRDYLGVSLTAARAIRKACSWERVSDAQKHMFRNMRERFLNTPPSKRSKRILFLFPEGKPPAIEGFTTKENTTLYLVMENELSEAKLVRMFAHELAMSYDQFNRIAQLTDPTTWQTGLAVAFDKKIFSRVFRDLRDEDPIRCAVRDPALQYAMATERAFRFEDQITRELGYGNNPTLAVNGTCRASVERWLPVLPDIYSTVEFDVDSVVGFLESNCGETEGGRPLAQRNIMEWGPVLDRIKQRLLRPADQTRKKYLRQRIATLENTRLDFLDGSGQIGLCELLLEPRVGAHDAGYFGGGPRPRAGGW